METNYKKAVESHIAQRLEELTSPVNFAYGYMTYHGAEERLTELHILAMKIGLYELAKKIGDSRRTIREKIEDGYRRGNFHI